MPYKKSTQSLQSLCLILVLNNIKYLKNDAQHLPCVLRNEFYENPRRSKRKQLPSGYMAELLFPEKIFITAGTKKIEFPPHAFKSKIIHICHNLRHLRLSEKTNIQSSELQQLLKYNPKLETVDLSFTNCCNLVLDVIAKNCKMLKVLNVSLCSNVDDVGIGYLCKKEMRISNLDISSTNVSKDGCLLALTNLPCLTDITYGNMMKIIEAPQNRNKVLSKSIQEVRRLIITKDGQLQRSSVAFPNLSELKILMSNVNEMSHLFVDFPQLKTLFIYAAVNGNQTNKFRDQIKPAFQRVNNLTKLTICDFPSVDLVDIGRSCPKLRNLSVSVSGGIDEEARKEPCPHVLFENLEVLIVVDMNYLDVEKEFELLLTNCKRLKSFEVKHSFMLSDEIFERFLRWNPMKHLERIELTSCPKITTKVLKHLMKLNNPLKKIFVHGCQNVDANLVNEFADEKCLDVEIIIDNCVTILF